MNGEWKGRCSIRIKVQETLGLGFIQHALVGLEDIKYSRQSDNVIMQLLNRAQPEEGGHTSNGTHW